MRGGEEARGEEAMGMVRERSVKEKVKWGVISNVGIRRCGTSGSKM